MYRHKKKLVKSIIRTFVNLQIGGGTELLEMVLTNDHYFYYFVYETGKIYHSVSYNDAVFNDTIEKRVVVVGIGNSAVDVACHCASAGR